MRHLAIVVSVVFGFACTVENPPEPTGGSTPPAPGGGSSMGSGSGPGPGSGGGSGSGSPGTGSGSGSNNTGTFGPNEPQLVDIDGDGVLDAIDIEPDGSGDYQFDTFSCGEPRIDTNHDGHVDAIDIDCNGQIDLLVSPTHQISPAPGANCTVGQPGTGVGHGAAGYGCVN
jgi:hypothetical protein